MNLQLNPIELLSGLPNLSSVFASATPLLLSFESVGFSPNEEKELVRFDIQLAGDLKSVFWIYDHSLGAFEDQSVNTKIASKYGASADDLFLSHVLISGSGSDENIVASYTTSTDSRVYLSQIDKEGAFTLDLIEQISGEILQQEIVKIASERDVLFVETAADLMQINSGVPLSPSDLVLDDNQSRDVYLIDAKGQNISYLSKLEGRSAQGHSELLDTYFESGSLKVLVKTKAAISSKDTNDLDDIIILNLNSNLEVDTLKYLKNSDGTFFNQGITAAQFFSNGEVLLETSSTNIDVMSFDANQNLLTYNDANDNLAILRFEGVAKNDHLGSIRLLDAASKGEFAILSGIDVDSDDGEQVYIVSSDASGVNFAQHVSLIDQVSLSANDAILAASISDYATSASIKLYSPTWVEGASLSDEGSFVVNSALLPDIDLNSHNLSGIITNSAGAILTNVRLTLETLDPDGQPITDEKQTVTNENSGRYDFEIAHGADVNLEAQLAYENTSRAITPQDALETLRLAIGLPTTKGSKTGKDFIAADFNKDGIVTPQDALEVLKYAVGLRDLQAEWIFLDADADYSDVTRKNVSFSSGIVFNDVTTSSELNLEGLLLGDINQSFEPIVIDLTG